MVYVTGENCSAGDLMPCEIVASEGYDLVAAAGIPPQRFLLALAEQASDVIYDAGIHHVTFQTEKHLTGNGSRLCLNNRCDQEMC